MPPFDMLEPAALRAAIRAEVFAIEALDALERRHLDETLAWIDSGAELCRLAKPATPLRHLVSYFAVVDPDAEKILLVDHRSAQRWLPAGGHVEPREHPRSTVLRELAEELALVPDHAIGPPLMLSCTATVGLTASHTDVSLWYVVHSQSELPVEWDRAEFAGVQWFAFDEVPLTRTDPHMGRFLNKLKVRHSTGGTDKVTQLSRE